MNYSTIVPLTGSVDVNGDTYTKTARSRTTILIDPIIKSGIYKFEILQLVQIHGVGIADESTVYGRGEGPEDGEEKKIVYQWQTGPMSNVCGGWVTGNKSFDSCSRIAVEVNMDSKPRTVTFFYDDVEQPNYCINIPAAIRFWVYIYYETSSFRITQLQKLSKPTAKHGYNSCAWEYGQKWYQKQAY